MEAGAASRPRQPTEQTRSKQAAFIIKDKTRTVVDRQEGPRTL